ncbi:uncharacterized protein AB9W97_019109 isoform 4-T8 [Spinachia spinachia]
MANEDPEGIYLGTFEYDKDGPAIQTFELHVNMSKIKQSSTRDLCCLWLHSLSQMGVELQTTVSLSLVSDQHEAGEVFSHVKLRIRRNWGDEKHTLANYSVMDA